MVSWYTCNTGPFARGSHLYMPEASRSLGGCLRSSCSPNDSSSSLHKTFILFDELLTYFVTNQMKGV